MQASISYLVREYSCMDFTNGTQEVVERAKLSRVSRQEELSDDLLFTVMFMKINSAVLSQT